MKDERILDSRGYSFLVVLIAVLMVVIFAVALRGNSDFWSVDHAPNPSPTPWMPGEEASP